MKISSSTQDKNKVVTVDLTIGQCRLLESLVDAELCEAEAHTSQYSQNSLRTLIDVFHEKTKPTPEERQEHLEKWVRSLKLKGFAHG